MTRTTQTPQALSPETFAVLACAQAVVHAERADLRARFRAALNACPSAERLCAAAVRHGMLGHVHKMASADEEPAIAPEVRTRLAELYRVSAERNLRQTAQLLRLLDLLEARGVEAMPVKGPALAERLYGDVTLRNWVDLDLVVRYEDVAAARAALLEAGFADSSPYNERLMRRRTRTEGEIALHASGDDPLLDLHWQLGVGYGADALTGEALLARAEPATLLGRVVRGPSAVDALLLTCLHGTRHRWDSVGLLLELAVQVRDLPEEEWPQALAAARATGLRRRLSAAVAHACRVVVTPLPAPVRAALAGDPRAARLRAWLTPAVLEVSGEVHGSRSLLDSASWVASEDSLAAGLVHGFLRAARPGPEDWATLALPDGLTWAYWPLRPLRLALKWARRAARGPAC